MAGGSNNRIAAPFVSRRTALSLRRIGIAARPGNCVYRAFLHLCSRCWKTALVASLAIVAGCVEYRPAPISAAAQADRLESRSLNDDRLQMFIAASLGSGNDFDRQSWNLATLTLAALYFHPDLEIARSKLEGTRAASITAGQSPNPNVSVALLTSPWAISPAIDFLIETFGRREYRTAQADALIDAAREDLVSAAWQVRGRVRSALLDIWAAQQRSDLIQRRLALQDQLVGLLERRFAEGEASSLDVTRERINRNQVNLLLRDAERQSAAARARLAAALGVPAQEFDGIALSFDAFDQPALAAGEIAAGIRRQALTSRSDVQGLLAEYRAAEAALRLEIAKQYPNLTLGPGIAFEPGAGRYELVAAGAAELPVFNRNQGQLAEAEARRRTVAARLTSLQAQIIGAIDAAAASQRTATATMETADILLVEAARRDEQISRSFEAGATDRPTLVSAAVELAIAELSRFEAGVQQREALGALEDALQRQLFEPVTNVPLPESNALFTAEPIR